MAKVHLSARAVALLLILNAKFYSNEREKEISPYRFTAVMLKRISGRSRLRTGFLIKLGDELIGEGWHLLQNDEVEFAIFPVPRTKGWAKLSSRRVMLLAAAAFAAPKASREDKIEAAFEAEFQHDEQSDSDED